MPVFSFAVVETLPHLDGVQGVILAGPVLDSSHNLVVGDRLVVQATSDAVTVTCTALVLADWGVPGWVTIAVRGVRVQDVRIGAVAVSQDSSQPGAG